MNISISFLNKISIIYLSIPLFIFVLGWYNPFFACISVLALFFLLRNVLLKNNDNKYFYIEKDYVVIIGLICLGWVIISGIGGFCWQHEDWHVRNALIHDLINFNYPVVYKNDTALVYYLGLFLPQALVGKFLLMLNFSGSVAFQVANIFSIFYFSFGIFLSMLYFVITTNAKGLKFIVAIAVFILFSGLDRAHVSSSMDHKA